MSNVNLEAAAVGRPVITTDIPGCREAVEDGVTGLYCQKQDADSLFQAMKEMTELTKAERSTMGLAARRHVERYFDKRDIVAETCQNIEEAI